MIKDSIGNRMKENYENAYRIKLTRRTPVILRLDGKAFHTLTRGCEKPFDNKLQTAMVRTGMFLMEEIQGAKCAYIQSDEISILLTDFDRLNTSAWFDNNLQKIVSISASFASVKFTEFYGKMGIFDSRAFNVPKEEVCNYFVWRQQDWFRNSLQMLSQSHFSHKKLHGKNTPDMHEMLHEKGVNWAELEPRWKNGVFLSKEERAFTVFEDVVLTSDRSVVEKHLVPKEE
ncbi:MAG: hypothetical protein DRO67_01685 [Candidatus Asgardarchaeum californiense]|nr:MAG: hypothetical protein DRO67_01685 [Candidatus Asgardarchaeum californiense]